MAEQKKTDQAKPSNKSKLANALEQAEEERKRRLMASRFEYARSGLMAYQGGDFKKAIKEFQTYIHIIEEVKNVSSGGLLPEHFDSEKEAAELLMICGVLWDLIKVYDRMNSEQKRMDFIAYLDKYVLLSRGMKFEHISSESIRKYVSTGHGKNVSILKDAYASLTNSRCFIATSLMDLTHAETISTLREFREDVLKKSQWGRWAMVYYYRSGPALAQRLNQSPPVIRIFCASFLDLLAQVIRWVCQS